MVPRQAPKRILVVSPAYHVSRVTLVMTPCNPTCRFMCAQVALYAGNDKLHGREIGI